MHNCLPQHCLHVWRHADDKLTRTHNKLNARVSKFLTRMSGMFAGLSSYLFYFLKKIPACQKRWCRVGCTRQCRHTTFFSLSLLPDSDCETQQLVASILKEILIGFSLCQRVNGNTQKPNWKLPLIVFRLIYSFFNYDSWRSWGFGMAVYRSTWVNIHHFSISFSLHRESPLCASLLYNSGRNGGKLESIKNS